MTKNLVLRQQFEDHIPIFVMVCKTSLTKLFPKKKIEKLENKSADEIVIIWANTSVSLPDTRCEFQILSSKTKIVKVSLVSG